MTREAFRASNLVLENGKIMRLNGLNLSLLSGETLGVYGLSNSGKTALLNVILGEEQAEGRIFYGGVPRSAGGRAGDIWLITKESSLLEGLTVWENLVVIRRHVTAHAILRPGLLSRMTAGLLEEYGCPFRAKDLVAELSPANRFITELLKAWMSGAKIILIDDFLSDFTTEEYADINRVISRFKEDGVAFLAASCRMEPLLALADRVAFLSGGRILRVMENSEKDRPEIRRLMDMMAPGSPVEKRRRAAREGPSFRIGLQTVDRLYPHLEIRSGEICAVIDPARTEVQWLMDTQKREKELVSVSLEGVPVTGRLRKRVLTQEIGVSEQILKSLSPMDNILMGSYDRFSRLGFILPHRLRAARQEFSDRYPDAAFLAEENCAALTEQDRAAIAMYRVFLKRPAAYIAVIKNLEIDRVTFNLIMKSIVALAEEGTAVCIVLASTEYMQDFADRYVLVTKNGVEYNVPFERIAGR